MALVSLGTSTVSILNPALNLSTSNSNKTSQTIAKKLVQNQELNSGVTVSYTIFAPTQPVVSIASNFITKSFKTVYDIESPTTVPNTGVSSRLPITSTRKNSITIQKSLKQDNRLKVLEITTNTIYNVVSLPVVPFIKNYRPISILKPEKLRTNNTVFTNTNALVNQVSSGVAKTYKPNIKTDKIRAIKASKLTVKTTTTFITAYSYWV